MTRNEWCTALAKLVSPAFPRDAQAALQAMLPAMQDLGDEMFTAETLLAVAQMETRQSVPSFREIRTAMGEHRSRVALTHRLAAPPNADLPPDRPAPPMEEVTYVARLLSRRDQEIQQREVERHEAPAAVRLPDVSLKGEALARLRASRFGQVRA